MDRPAARRGDTSDCPQHAVGAAGAPDRAVFIEGRVVVGSWDTCNCMGDPLDGSGGIPNVVAAGVSDVWFGEGGRPMSGVGHPTQHSTSPVHAANSALRSGAASVIINGNIAVGNLAAATLACEKLKAGRPDGSATQSAQNCGIEACRQLIQQQGKRPGDADITEKALLDEALEKDVTNVLESKLTRNRNFCAFVDRMVKASKACDQARAKASAALTAFDRYRLEELARDECACYRRLADEMRERTGLDPNAAVVEAEKRQSYNRRISSDPAFERSEKERLAKEATSGSTDEGKKLYPDAGGTHKADQQRLLQEHGVEADFRPNRIDDLATDVAAGKGVIIAAQAGLLWDTQNDGNHAVVVTGIEYDQDGNILNVVYNDSAVGCRRRGTKQDVQAAMDKSRVTDAVVTKHPIYG